ncbi:MAG: tail fiber domain-containing protein, partial [Pyrinomonadaceae bacterium]
MKKNYYLIIGLVFFSLWSGRAIYAQTTDFTFQGQLQNASAPANGNFDFEFSLFDALSGGTQFGVTLTQTNVAVVNGVFSVKLNFGSQFPGANRFLEIHVRQSGGGAFTPLSPRQAVTSAPYSITSLNATTATNAAQLGGVTANQYILTGDTRLSDSRNPLPNSPNYIQNNSTQQASSNFNISGNGTAGGTLSGNIINAATQFNLNGSRILSTFGAFNLAVGLGAGSSISSGGNNSFFGASAGLNNTIASNNSFFGASTGLRNTTGSSNSFFGSTAGGSNTTGSSNSFFGDNAGRTNVTGFNLSIFGNSADVSDGISNATAIGFRSKVTQSNSLVLGGISGVNGGSNTNVGIGTTSPGARLHIAANGGQILMGDAGCTSGFAGVGFGTTLSGCGNYSLLGDGADTIINRPAGGKIFFREDNATQVSISSGGVLAINALGAAGSTSLCRNASNQISTCSSSIRYKENINRFSSGLSLIGKLRPVSFNWKDGGMLDFGLVAEEAAEVEPLLITRNAKGEVEGVKYDRVGVVLINAAQEQQLQIEAQQKQIDEQKQSNES